MKEERSKPEIRTIGTPSFSGGMSAGDGGWMSGRRGGASVDVHRVEDGGRVGGGAVFLMHLGRGLYDASMPAVRGTPYAPFLSVLLRQVWDSAGVGRQNVL